MINDATDEPSSRTDEPQLYPEILGWAWTSVDGIACAVIAQDPAGLTIRAYRNGNPLIRALHWSDVTGLYPTSVTPSTADAQRITKATQRTRYGHLSHKQRDALATLLHVASHYPLPQPLRAVLAQVLDVINDPRRPADPHIDRRR